MRSLNTLLCVILLASSCVAKRGQRSDVHGLSADSSARNVAVLVQGTIPQGANDISRIEAALTDPKGNYNYTVQKLPDATTRSAIDAIGNAAGQVGPNGTLFIFMDGHGSPDGGLLLNDDSLVNYFEVREAIAKNRTTPLKRLVIIIFACYSGSWINNIGTVDMTKSMSPKQITQAIADRPMGQLASRASPIYEQLFIMTSSNSSENSWFNGDGSEFIENFEDIYADLRAKSLKTATMQTLVDRMTSALKSSNVMFAASPQELVMQEKLFNTEMEATPQPDDLFARLGALDANGSAEVFLSASPAIKDIRLCVNTAAICYQTMASSFGFNIDPTTTTAKRMFMRSTGAIHLSDIADQPITLLGIGDQGKLVSARAIQIKSK